MTVLIKYDKIICQAVHSPPSPQLPTYFQNPAKPPSSLLSIFMVDQLIASQSLQIIGLVKSQYEQVWIPFKMAPPT